MEYIREIETLSQQEIKALRSRPANELTPEELWRAHGAWLLKLCSQVASTWHQVEITDLVGLGYEYMLFSARRFRATGGAGFCHFSKRLILPRLHQHARHLSLGSRPAPKTHTAKDPCVGSVSLDYLRDLSTHRDRGATAAHLLGQAVEHYEDWLAASSDLCHVRADSLVDVSKLMGRVERRLKRLRRNKDPEIATLGRRLHRIFVEGETGAEVADSEGVSRQAINYAIRTGRLYLRDLIGQPRLSLAAARKLSRRNARERGLSCPRSRAWEKRQQAKLAEVS